MKPIIRIFAILLVLGLWWPHIKLAAQQTDKTNPTSTTVKKANNKAATDKPTTAAAKSKSGSAVIPREAAKKTTLKAGTTKTAVNPKKSAEKQNAKTASAPKKTAPALAQKTSGATTAVVATSGVAAAAAMGTNAAAANDSAAQKKAMAKVPKLPLKGFGATMTQAGESAILQVMATMANNGQIDTTVGGNYLFSFNGQPHTLLFTRGTATYVFAKDSLPARLFIEHAAPDGKKMEQMLQIKQGENGTPIPQNMPRWVALIPILLAVLLSFLLREPIFSLFAAIFIGIWSLNGFAIAKLLPSLIGIFDRYLVATLSNPNYISLLTAVLLAGGMGALITHNGGINGLATGFSGMVRSPRGAQLTAWWTSILVFFDQPAGIIMGGQVARPLTDRLRVSREKLAYILNTVSSSVAVLALFGTFAGLVLLPLGNVLKNAGNAASPVSVWLFSLQYAFYPVWMLLFALCSTLFLRDFGPMLRAERRARFEGRLFDSRIADETAKAEYATTALPIGNKVSRGYNALLPLLVFVVTAFIGVFYTSFDKTLLDGTPTQVGTSILQAAQQANPYQGLLWGSVAGILTAMVLTILGRWLSLRGTVESILSGMKNTFPYIAVLLLTLTLAQVCGELHTADYIVTWFPASPVAYIWLPIFAFVITALLVWGLGTISAAVVFAMPIMLSLAWQMAGSIGLGLPLGMALFYGTIASLVAGALFGSQISIIAQNTVLSSLAADCPTADHVHTQLPYSLLLAFLHLAATILCILLPVSAWMIMVGGMVLLPLILFILGRQPKPIITDKDSIEKQSDTEEHTDSLPNEESINPNNTQNETAVFPPVLGSAAAIIGASNSSENKPQFDQDNYPTTPIEEDNDQDGVADNMLVNIHSNDAEIGTEADNTNDTIKYDVPYWEKNETTPNNSSADIDKTILSEVDNITADEGHNTHLYDTEPLADKYNNDELISPSNESDTEEFNPYKAVFETEKEPEADKNSNYTKGDDDTENYGFITLNDRLKQWRDAEENNKN